MLSMFVQSVQLKTEYWLLYISSNQYKRGLPSLGTLDGYTFGITVPMAAFPIAGGKQRKMTWENP